MKYDYLTKFTSFIIGTFTYLLGGFDVLLISLCVVMCADWLTGVLKALKKGRFSYDVGVWGIVNKIVSLVVVIVVNAVQQGVSIGLPIRETVLVMILINESLSVISNASTFVKGLEPLSKYFEGLKVNAIKLFSVEERKTS